MGRAKEAMLVEEEAIARQQQEDEALQYAADEAEAAAEEEADRLHFERAEAAEAKVRVESIIYEMNTIVENFEKDNLEILEAKLREQDTETLIQFGRHYYERAKWLERMAKKLTE